MKKSIMKKKVKTQKRIVNIAILAPILIAGMIGIFFEDLFEMIPENLLGWTNLIYYAIVLVVAGIVDRCPYCKKYLGFRHSCRCPSCGKSFN